MRVMRGLAVTVVVLSACSDGAGPADQLAELAIEMPAGTSVDRKFPIAVRALDDNGDVNVRTNGTVSLSVSTGTISPVVIEMHDGVATDSARIMGATGYVTVVASLAGRTKSLAVRIADTDDRLSASAAGLASTSIPDVVFRSRGSDYGTTHPTMPGLPISFNTILLATTAGARVRDVNAALDAVAAEIVGGVPGHSSTGGILMLRLPTTTYSAMEEALTLLRAHPAVAAAAPDVLISGDVLPRNGPVQLAGWEWETLPGGGNIMLEMGRVPQMWNLNDAITKAMGPAFRVDIGIIDDGFNSAHEDLLGAFGATPVGSAQDHGTEVAGVIAATFGNGKGLDGVNPFASLYTSTAPSSTDPNDPIGDRLTSVGDLMRTRLREFIGEQPGLRVINMSAGFNWAEWGVFPSSDPGARALADSHGTLFMTMLQALQQNGVPLPVIVVSSGNSSATAEGGVQEARYNSPMANAALRPNGAKNIIVTEALAVFEGSTSPVRFPGSDVGGHVSAIGFNVYTTTSGGYGFKDGTSMAAPFVAGVVGYLYALDPTLPGPTLTSNPVLDILLGTAVPVPGAAPYVDAFGAALHLDSRLGVFNTLRALVDVDDGTDDGNLRIDPVTHAIIGGEDEDADGGPGDRVIDMSDFRRLRDALLQVEGVGTLDGSPSHPKKDLNGDGNFKAGELENLYPRLDFNGDGRISRTATHVMRGIVNGQSLTDLQVLQLAFTDDDVPTSALPGLIDSGDFHVDGTACMSMNGAATVQTDVVPAGGGSTQSRIHSGGFPIRIITAPAGAYTLRTRVLDAGGGEIFAEERDTTVQAGEDILWRPLCVPGPFHGMWRGSVEFFGGFTGVTDVTLQLAQTGSTVTGTWSLTSGFSGNWTGGISGSTMTFNAVLVSPSDCSGSGSGTLVLEGNGMTGGGTGSGTCEGGRTFTFTIGNLSR